MGYSYLAARGLTSMAARLCMLKRGATSLVSCCMPLQLALGLQMACIGVHPIGKPAPHNPYAALLQYPHLCCSFFFSNAMLSCRFLKLTLT
jgi:hypothetical protein